MEWMNQGHVMPGSGYGPVPGMAAVQRSGPYSTGGPMPTGPLPPGAVKPAPAVAAAGMAPSMPAGGCAPGFADFMSPEMEKSNLLNRLDQLQKSNPDAKAKWWSFCKVHGEGNFDANKHDSAFLQTFFEAFELGEVPDEPGCPFPSRQPAAPGPGTGWTPAGTGQEAAAPPQAQDGGAGQMQGTGVQPEKIFVGGLPKTATEEGLWQHFQWYGPVISVDLKYDAEGGFRGFGFVTFQDSTIVAKVLADKEGCNFMGKWIDCKVATGPGTGTGKGFKGDKGKGFKGDKGDKGKGKKGDGGKAWGGCGDWSGGYGGSKGSKDGGKSKGAGPGNNDELKIFVGAMPKTITQEAVWNYFTTFGEVKSVDLKYDEMGGFRGFGFVTFATQDSVQLAVGNTASNYLDGKWVDVKPAAKGGGGGKGGGKDGAGKDGKASGKDGGKSAGGKGEKGDKGKGKGDKGGKSKGKGDKGKGGQAALGWGGGYGGDWSMMGGGWGMGGCPGWGWGW